MIEQTKGNKMEKKETEKNLNQNTNETNDDFIQCNNVKNLY